MRLISKIWRGLVHALAYDATFRALVALNEQRLAVHGLRPGQLDWAASRAADRLAGTD